MIFRNELGLKHQQPIDILLMFLFYDINSVIPFIDSSKLAPNSPVDLFQVEVLPEVLVFLVVGGVQN